MRFKHKFTGSHLIFDDRSSFYFIIECVRKEKTIMPELPEVQSFVNSISKNYLNKEIVQIIFHREDLRYPFETDELQKIFSPATHLLKCARVGKKLILETQKGAVAICLGMTGAFIKADINKPQKHEHVTLIFRDGEALGYTDSRRFGYWLVSKNQTDFAIDPLSAEALLTFFSSAKIKNSERKIKDLLMDQKLIGGIGNIYAIESLFISKIHPLQPCAKITLKQWKLLAQTIPHILTKAIECQGSSIASYRTLDGTKGHFQKMHLVYQRENKPCCNLNCLGVIKRIKDKGRSSWYCSHCQLLKQEV